MTVLHNYVEEFDSTFSSKKKQGLMGLSSFERIPHLGVKNNFKILHDLAFTIPFAKEDKHFIDVSRGFALTTFGKPPNLCFEL